MSMTFQGAPPSWLVGDDKRSKPIFAGSLMMYDVKDLSLLRYTDALAARSTIPPSSE